MCFSIVGCVKMEEKEIKSMTFKVPDTYNKVRDDKDIKDGDYGWEVRTKSYKKDKNKYVLVTYAIYDFHQRRRAGSPDFLSRGGIPDLAAYFPF